MATKQLYKALGVSGYEHRACWRKAGTFFLSLSAPQSCHQCPKCGNREVIHRGTFTRTVHGLPGIKRASITGLLHGLDAGQIFSEPSS